MNKKFFVIAASIAALTFTASCSDDDSVSSVKPNDLPSSAGQIKSGTDADDALPQGYKISSVDSYDFTYDSNGKLIAIDDLAVKDGVIKYTWREDGETENLEIKIASNSKGCITGITTTDEYKWGSDREKTITTTKYEYNSNNQLSKTKTVGKFEGVDEGYKYKGDYTITSSFTYDGKKLTKVVIEGSGNEDGDKFKDKDVYKLRYDNTLNNIFYQFTPEMAEIMEDVTWESEDIAVACAYLGMFGRGSSMLPSSIDHTYEWTEDGESDSDSSTHNCGSYRFNSYGALSSVGYTYYSYTTNSNSPYGVKSFEAKKKATLHDRIQKIRTRIHVK